MNLKEFNVNDIYDIIDDIQRVETNCLFLQERLLTLLNVAVTLSIRTDWKREDIPTIEEMERIRSNVEKLAKAIAPLYTIPVFENHFDYRNANDLEIALQFIEAYLQELISLISQPRAGFYYASEPLYLIVERQVNQE